MNATDPESTTLNATPAADVASDAGANAAATIDEAPRARRRRPPREAADAVAAPEPLPAPRAEGDDATPPPNAPQPGSGEQPPAAERACAGDGSDPAARAPRSGRNRRRGRRGRGARDARDAGPVDVAEAVAAAPVVVSTQEDPQAILDAVVAGEFDAEDAPAATVAVTAAPPKRVLAAEPDAPKLHKLLAQAGVGSRRDMEQMIVEGRITVNGQPAHIGQRISWGDQVRVGGKPVKLRIVAPAPRVLAYHKPVGEIVTHDDPQQRPTVFRRLPRLAQGKWQSVGRLDINTEGLLLFTNSGELANQLMHPRFGVEREYAVRVLGTLDDAQRERLLDGIEIDGHTAALRSIVDGGGEGANHWYRVVIAEGRNREVRRLFDAVGLVVSRLIRIRYGSVVLPRGLKRGLWVELGDGDVAAIRRLAQGERPPRADDAGGRGVKRKKRGRGAARPDVGTDRFDGAAIPSPLQQTYDKRAIQRERAVVHVDDEDGPIPNPLQQTYDKRALQRERAPRREPEEGGPIPNPLEQTYDKRFVQKSPGVAAARRGGADKKRGGGAPREPDPMRTSVGYIGGDAFLRAGNRGGGRRGKR